MKIIVTGGAGFLGTHLCRGLDAAGHEVRVIDLLENPEYPTTIADVKDAALMKKEITDADVVFHLAGVIQAGESVEKPQMYVDENIDGTLNVLEAMRENWVPTFIFSSSAAVYGEPQNVPIKEDDRTMPINPYGMTKLAMEGLVSSYVYAHGMNGVALRYFNLYGPEEHHQPETHAIPRFIEQIYQDKEVTVWGSGEHLRDYIHVRDVVDAHLKAMELVERQPKEYHYINLSSEKGTSVMEIVQLIEKVMGKKANVKHFPPRPGDPLVLYADATKAHDLLGWRTEVDLEAGLTETVNYFLSHQEEDA